MSGLKPTNKRSQFVQMLILCMGISAQLPAAQPGEPAPELVLPLLNKGNEIRLSDFEGTVVYVDFWASWCGPCRKSLPLYEDLYQRLLTKQFQLLAVNLDEDTRDAIGFLNRHPVSYPVLVDPAGNSARTWSVLAMPSSYLIDFDGKLAHTYVGFESSHMERIEHDIKTLLERMPAALPAGDDGLR